MAESKTLVQKVIDSTGLPKDGLKKEMDQLLSQSNLNHDTLSLEELRTLLASYLQDVFVELKNERDAS